MMLQLLASTALALGAVLPAPAPPGPVERFIDDELPSSGVPGLAYAVVSDGDITAVGARGVLRRGGDGAVTPDTPFVTGSLSKSFTALAVMQLVESGEIGLDAGVANYVRALSGRPAAAITIRQLLNHTSGFSTLQGNARPTDISGGKDELERRIERIAATTPAREPGLTWEYSNTNYEILGRLIEVVSGQEFQAYVTANILEPLGMKHSFVADGKVHASMATGHTPWFGTKRPLADGRTTRGTAPQGGIVASARDLALYLRMMMNGQDDLLSAEGKALMMRPAGPASPFYGFGWFVDSRHHSVWHSGSSPGFDTLATLVPARKEGVVVLLNGGSGVGFGDTTALRQGITARALQSDYGDDRSGTPQKALFVGLLLLPVGYLLSTIWAWRHRVALRAKSGVLGLFSLWFPLLTTLVAAWVVLDLAPSLVGSPLDTIRLFQPDLGLALTATAATGVLWAVFRLAVAHAGRTR